MSPRILLPTLLLFSASAHLRAAAPTVDSSELPRVPPTPPERALSTFRVKPGFRLELVAAEPQVIDPIALSFDERGRMFVVEMRDYSERRPERLGRIRLLEDTDGDGRCDRSTVFAQDLPWPTAVICYGGGVFVGCTPDIIWMKDTNDDGVADQREVVFTGFASDYAPFATNKLNVQALLNSFNWSLDNRIHGAASFSAGKVHRVDSDFVRNWRLHGGPGKAASANASAGDQRNVPEEVEAKTEMSERIVDLRGRDFSFDPQTLDLRAESGGGQHGLTFDHEGRKFVCANSSHIQAVLYEERYAAAQQNFSMPRALVDIAVDGGPAPVFRISPDEPWRVIRTRWRVAGLVPGPIEGGGRPSGYFTGATGVTIYRGDAYGEDFVDDAFIGDAGSNLVHRKKIKPDGVSLKAMRPADEQDVEFLASTDNWFRPVQFANGPDGCLYICDMYREIIEHPWSLPETIKQHLDLNSGNDRGRIYRVVPERFQRGPRIDFTAANGEELPKLLAHPNGWTRDTAARLIYERRDRTLVGALRPMLEDPSTYGSLHALAALDGLGALTVESVVAGLTNRRAAVRRHALRLSEKLAENARASIPSPVLMRLAADPDAGVRFQLALTLGITAFNQRLELVDRLLTTPMRNDQQSQNHEVQRGMDDEWLLSAAVQALGDDVGQMFQATSVALGAGGNEGDVQLAATLAALIGRRNRTSELNRVLNFLGKTPLTIAAKAKDASAINAAMVVAGKLAQGVRQAGQSLRTIDRREQTTNLFTLAAQLARRTSTDDRERVPAIFLLGFDVGYEPAGPILVGLLTPDPVSGLVPSAKVQQAAVVALESIPAPEIGPALVARWPRLTPSTRTLVIDLLLKRTERVRVLLGELRKGTIKPVELSSTQQALLRQHRDDEIRTTAAAVLGPPPASRQEVIAAFRPALALTGNGARGRSIFEARCAICHRVGPTGHVVGPDLVTVRNAGREKLLVNILDPNRELNGNFTSYAVETTDGESLVGIIAGENRAEVTLRMPGGVETVLRRNRIASLQSQGRSLMPEGLEEGLKAQDLADLMEFVLNGR